jgi:hypothetical protein
MSIEITRTKQYELAGEHWISKGQIVKIGPDVVSYQFQETATGNRIPYLAILDGRWWLEDEKKGSEGCYYDSVEELQEALEAKLNA